MDQPIKSSKYGSDYQVFLSFRGPDTRQGFTDCLYHFLTSAGVRVFKDDVDQPIGAEIKKILDAINSSVICIPIFSKSYASSKWCLRELARMVELGKTILPIFYDVTPDDVKLKTNLYVDEIQKLNHYVDEKGALTKGSDLVQWKKALVKVGSYSGRCLESHGFGEFSISIVTEVLMKLKARDKIITDTLVGIDEHVEAIVNLMDVESPEVRFVGIHGMGGIGKSTLAKVVFNKVSAHFDHCIFLNNVRSETSKSGPIHLQKQLLRGVQPKFRDDIADIDDGIRKIKDLLNDKKVLVVLDDIDHMDQINKLAGNSSWFGGGSKIVITTRDKRLLTVVAAAAKAKVMVYESVEMNYYQALQLFSKHAFKEESPPQEYLDLAKQVISAVGKLPLTLEVIGSHFRGKPKEEWMEKIRMLGQIPDKDVQAKLMISYESLDYRTRQIFLDIACFFAGSDKTNPIYMWKACNLRPDSGLEDLISKSLVKITDDDDLWMHDQLQELGKEIVSLENVMDIGRRSRLWEHWEAENMLKRREGTRKIEAIRLPMYMTIKHEDWGNLRNLRFLECNGSCFIGEFKHLLSKLTWLKWKFCPIEFTATSLNLESLVILDISGSEINEEWNGWTQMEIGFGLKVIDLGDCENLRETPDLSKYYALERLILDDCKVLVRLHSSIGELNNLKYLSLAGCASLEGLPNAISGLHALDEIIMVGHGQSFTLPESLGSLASLKTLDIEDVEIIGGGVPESIGQLLNLQRLFLFKCKGIAQLNNSLGELKALKELVLSKTDITWLPDSIGSLEELEMLSIRKTKIRSLPNSIGGLKKLEKLYAGNSPMESIPTEIQNLSSLKILILKRTNIRKLPPLTKLSKLETLSLNACQDLCELPHLPTGLITLKVKSKSLHKLPDLSNLDRLTYLKYGAEALLKPTNLQWILKLNKLERLSLRVQNVTYLPTDLRSFFHLKKLSLLLSGGGGHGDALLLPPTLSCLSLIGCIDDQTRRLPDISYLKNLSEFKLANFSLEEGFEKLGIRQLDRLQYLSLVNCEFMELNFLHMPNLLELKIWGCNSLTSLDCIPVQPRNLHSLHVEACQEIIEIPGLGELKRLEKLHLIELDSLDRLDNLSNLMSLSDLCITSCRKLKVAPQGIDPDDIESCILTP